MRIEPIDINSPSEVNYEKLLKEINGVEVGYKEFLITNKPVGTRRLELYWSCIISKKN